MREETRKTCRDQASTSRIRNFSMTLDYDAETWRYLLLPVYLATYRYQDKTYQVFVNGQTGDVAGQRPVDWLKVWLVVAAILAPGVTLSLFGIVAVLFGLPGPCLGLVGLGLLMTGLFFAYHIIREAMSLDDI